jgi:hypothetical protein
MKQRSIGKMFLLSIVTLGIYRLYWFDKTRTEMMSLNKAVKIPRTIWLIAPVLFMVAAMVFFFVAVLGNSDGSGAEQTMTGLQVGALITFYVAVFTAPLLMAIWLWQYSRGVELVTNEKMGFATALLILLVVPDGIDILIVQESFNKIALPAPTGPVAPASN